MIEFAIDNDIPLTVHGQARYPFRKLQVGQSFFVSDPKRFVGCRRAASMTGPRIGNGVKFVTRTVTENGVKGVRIWRVS